jgi:hypothetical protein
MAPLAHGPGVVAMNRADLIGQAAEAIERTIGGFGLDIDGSAAAAVDVVLSAVADDLADEASLWGYDRAFRLGLKEAAERIRSLLTTTKETDNDATD